MGPRAIVAIPVRNEAERIGACLEALADQSALDPGALGIVLFLNNCTDDTAAVASAVDMRWPVRIIERHDAQASAGWARRIALNAASDWLLERPARDGVLLTSDADSRVRPDWVSRNLEAIAAGADLVAGRISLDPVEAAALPTNLHIRGRLEAQYEALLVEIDARLDPDLGNPWPCHWSKSGATLAVRHAVYLDVGGLPDISTGEDRAFVDIVRGHDFVVRHDCGVEVITSGRLRGRASGGVADTIRLRCEVPDSPCDDRLEPLQRVIFRNAWRRRLRQLYYNERIGATWRWAPALSIPKSMAKAITSLPRFGLTFAAIEKASPRLTYRPVRPTQLPQQIRRAARILRLLQAIDGWRGDQRSQRHGPRLTPDARRISSEPLGDMH